MLSTQQDSARLATGRIDRDAIARGYRPNALLARIGTRAARLNALERLCLGAERKPGWLYDARKKDENRALPCERMDAAIVQGITEGYITPEVLADYFGDLFALYRAMMPGAADATYLDTAREKAEAIEAMSIARANPTPENCAAATRELAKDAIVTIAYTKRAGAA